MKRLLQDDKANVKLQSSIAVVDELLFELSLAQMVKEDSLIQRTSPATSKVAQSGHVPEEGKELT